MSAQDTDNANAVSDALSFTNPTTSTHASKQVVAGIDSSFTFDGITITRPNNKITDLVQGVTLDLNATSSATVEIGAAYDETQALDILTAFVTEVNTLRTSMTNMTDMGIDGGEGGPLRGDTCLLYTSPSPRDLSTSRMPSSA